MIARRMIQIIFLHWKKLFQLYFTDTLFRKLKLTMIINYKIYHEIIIQIIFIKFSFDET